MKFQTVVDSLNYSWEQVTIAFWARYPNPFASHVLTEDVLSRELRPDGTLFTRRLLMKTNSMPNWARKLMPASRVPVIEESVIDPVNRTLTTYSRNVTHKNLMETTEKVIYTSYLNDAGIPLTRCDKMFWVSSQWYAPTRYVIERFGVQRWTKNATKTSRGFQFVLRQIYDEDDAVTTTSPLEAINAVPAVPRHPFIAEKRRQLRESALRMSHRAKEKLEKTRENAKVTIETAQDNFKDKFGVRGAEG